MRTHCLDCDCRLEQRLNSRRKRCDPCGRKRALQNSRDYHKRRQAINAQLRAAAAMEVNIERIAMHKLARRTAR